MMVLLGCKERAKTDSDFKGIAIITADKTTTSEGKVVVDSSWLVKYFNDSYTIYKLPSIQLKDRSIRKRNDTIDVVLSNPDTTFRYFVLRESEDNGIEYGNDLKMIGRFSLETLLRNNGLHPDMFGAYALKLTEPASIEKNGSVTIERYLNNKLAEGDSDSIYRYFDTRLNRSKFSFAPDLDNGKKGKLYKTSFVNIYSGAISRTEFYAEFKEVAVRDSDKISRLASSYPADQKKLGKQ